MTHGVIAVECGIGEMAALISVSDAFIGYDSACQHIAAALKVPTTTVFAGTNNMGFIRRWSARGDTRCSIVHVNTLEEPSQVDIDDVVLRIMGEVVGTERRAVRERIVETRRRRARDAAIRRDVLDEVP
jgi:ADP-heptose:LPS heptosyltransferase